MSSFLGHALIGISIGSDERNSSFMKRTISLSFFAFLAISPDIDYLGIWLIGYEIEPRYTHSIGFCLLVSFLSVFIYKIIISRNLCIPVVMSIILAPLSHLALDYFVGVHESPFLWPIYSEKFCSSIGILPSAGRIDLQNIYFWRNLLIEMAILLPVAVCIKNRGIPKEIPLIVNALLFGFFCVGIVFGLNLSR
ncbi:MAG: hypothetical protein HPY82_27010 [Gammaproteobacteria bacterium]|nr:hypothetical protein [Gammaproteobacteria bacterium]